MDGHDREIWAGCCRGTLTSMVKIKLYYCQHLYCTDLTTKSSSAIHLHFSFSHDFDYHSSTSQTPSSIGSISMSNELQYLRMEDHDIIPSCLSADPHKPRDFLLHYMGCEQFYQREEYLESLTADQTRQVEAKLRRIQYLRDAIAADPDKGAGLVQHLTASLRAWRATKDYQDGIVRIRRQRVQYFAVNGTTQKDVVTRAAHHPGEYNPDMDTNAYLIRFKNGRPAHGMQDGRFHEQYPSLRISIQDLVYGKEDLSMLYPPGNTINYFHFPANNLLVSVMTPRHSQNGTDIDMIILVG